MKWISMLLLIVGLSMATWANASEPIPRGVFIKYTETALDTLDELEIAVSNLSSSSSTGVARLKDKLDVALKKYDRHIKGEWPGGKQKEIVWRITEARIGFDIAETSGMEYLTKAKESGDAARTLFTEYNKQTDPAPAKKKRNKK